MVLFNISYFTAVELSNKMCLVEVRSEPLFFTVKTLKPAGHSKQENIEPGHREWRASIYLIAAVPRSLEHVVCCSLAGI